MKIDTRIKTLDGMNKQITQVKQQYNDSENLKLWDYYVIIPSDFNTEAIIGFGTKIINNLMDARPDIPVMMHYGTNHLTLQVPPFSSLVLVTRLFELVGIYTGNIACIAKLETNDISTVINGKTRIASIPASSSAVLDSNWNQDNPNESHGNNEVQGKYGPTSDWDEGAWWDLMDDIYDPD